MKILNFAPGKPISPFRLSFDLGGVHYEFPQVLQDEITEVYRGIAEGLRIIFDRLPDDIREIAMEKIRTIGIEITLHIGV